jgi:glycosyltransferase involved in cell wall biosynthesis
LKVLLITYYWPPAGGSGVQRWLKFVKYLPEFGIEPVVYTVKDPDYAIEDSSLLNELPEGLEVLRGDIWEPNRILSKLSKSKKDNSSGFLNPNPSFIERQLQFVRANYFIPDARKFWIKPSVKQLSDYLEKNHIDVIITTGPPHSLHLIGHELKIKFGVKWLADFRDPWTNIDYFHSLPLTKKSRKKHFELETMVLEKADAVLVVGMSMKDEFSDRTNKVQVLSNGYDDFKLDREIELDKKFSMSHIGLMNADRNPMVLWRALKELREESEEFGRDLQVNLIGKCAGEVYQAVADFNLKDKVDFIGYVDHQEVLAHQRASQVLLLSVNKVSSSRSIITGKVFEYLQSQRPILGIGPVDGDLAEILEDCRAGTMVDFEDVQSLKNVVTKYYKAYKAGKLVANSQNVNQYHRRNLTANLAKLLNKL